MNSENRQRLLELVYDLLPEAEAAELRGRIAADPEWAAAHHDAQETARLLGEAARLRTIDFPQLRSNEPAGSEGAGPIFAGAAAKNGTAPRGGKSGRSRERSFGRAANWTVGAAAALLVLISVGGYFYHRDKLDAIAAEHLRLVVTGPSVLQAGAASEYLVSATAINGQALPAQIEVSLMAPDGRRLKSVKDTTDERGRMTVAVPADLPLPSETRLRVVAWRHDAHEEAETTLTVEPPQYDVQLSLDRPLYQPGDTLYYRALVLSRFALAADREFPLHFEILDPAGSVVADSAFDAPTTRGVAGGAFTIPDVLAGGQYTLVVRGQDRSFAERRRTFFIRRYRVPRLKKELEFTRDSYAPGQIVTADFKAVRAEGGPAAGAALRVLATVDGQTVHEQNAKTADSGTYQVSFKLPEKIERGEGQLAVVIDDGGTQETQAKTIPINLGKFKVEFFPEGGDLVAGLESRVYFTARDPLGKPVHLSGEIWGTRDNEDGTGRRVAILETTFEGRGVFRFTPEPDTSYRLKIASPVGAKNEPLLPPVNPQCNVVLNTGEGVFAPDKPVEFNVRAAKADLPLVAAAYCRGVQVGQQPLVTRGGGEGNPVSIALDPTVGGVVRLTVYDYSQSPPQPVAERLVYRRPSRRLNIRMLEDGRRYVPGERVALAFQVSDETGAPVPAALGVAVVDDSLLKMADDHTPAMPTYFLLTGEMEKPEDLEDADFYLSDRTKNGVQAARALDLLLGTQGWRRFEERPTLVAKNGDRSNFRGTGAESGTAPFTEEKGQAHFSITNDRKKSRSPDTAAPPFVFDNIAQIRENYRKCVADYQAARTPLLNTLTAVSFVGGIGLVLLVAMLGLMRICSGMHLWIPAIGATTCCLIVGAILMDPGRMTPTQDTAVAFTSNAVIARQMEKAADNAGLLRSAMPLEEFNDPGDKPDDFSVLGKLRKPLGGPEELRRSGMKKQLEAADGFAFHDRRADKLKGDAFLARDIRDGKDMKAEMAEQLADDEAAGERRFREKKRADMAVVRQYAHRHKAGPPGVRSDFAETLFWHPLLLADKDGKASAEFDLSDAVTTFRISVDAHGAGRIGDARAEIAARIPFNLEPKLPLEVSAGDRIDLPLAVVNDTREPLPVELRFEAGPLVTLDGQPERKLTLPADSRGREFFVLNVTGQKGKCDVTFRGKAAALSDAVTRPLEVVPPGFPKTQSFSGQLDGKQEVVVRLPETWVPGSLEVSLSVMPSTLANLQKGLEGILQEPNGCFEQASTANYPNVMTMQYLEDQREAAPEVTRRAKDLLQKGYARLTGYECKQKGFEWFGGDPGHEALTAYGLMQFRDMQRVFAVDPALIARTAEWLLARRDGRGGFERNPRALDSFGAAPPDVTNAYITWALAESGQKGIDAEVKQSLETAKKSDDPYVVALAAATALDAGDKEAARELSEKLAKSQADDGHLDGRQGSITRSGGISLRVETTALAALAWMRSPEFAPQANKAIEWIVKNRQGGGGFGSTQATILALKALVEHAKANRRAANAGVLTVERDGREVGRRDFSAGASETLSIDGIEAALTAGDNHLNINLTGDNRMPYVLNVLYRTLQPESSEACPLRLTTKLAVEKVQTGETVALTAELKNATDRGQPMAVAIVGLPAGLEPRAEQLEELKKSGAIDYYETRPREMIFYWRGLAPKRAATLKLDLVAAVPGRYTGPASRAYLYYTPEDKWWTEPLRVEIAR